MRHFGGRSALPIRFIRNFSRAAAVSCLCGGASLVALLAPSAPARADVVWAKKDCITTPCTITMGGSSFPLGPGQFRVIGTPISWDASYPSTQGHFWVGKNGTNMVDLRLSTTPGQLGGTYDLALGTWYISIHTGNMGWGTYSVFGPNVKGDPHITTMDGVHYDFQAAGEFTVLKNRDAGFEVQSRMVPISTLGPLPPDPHTGISTCPSINTAAAVKSPGHRFSYQPAIVGNARSPQMQLRIDGRRVSVRPQGMTLNDGTRINLNRASGELRITLRNRWGVRIVPNWWAAAGLWYLDYDFTPATSASGIAGPLARGSWLPALSDGRSVGSMPGPVPQRYKVLYQQFADSWRVSPATSLFDYSPGTSTASYTNAAWPGESGNCRLPNSNPLAQMNEADATRICAGVHVPHFKRACIADVMATGDQIFAAGYVKLQGPVRYKGRAPEGKAVGMERGLRMR